MKYWYGFWAVFCSVVTFAFASVGVMSLFAFDTSEFDMGIIAIGTFGMLIVFAWVSLSASLYLWGKCLGKERLIETAKSMPMLT